LSDPSRFSFLPSPGAGATSAGTRVLVTAAALVVVVAGLKAGEELLVPLVFAAFIALLTAPVVFWLEARRVPPPVAVSIVMLGLLVLIAGVGTLLGGSVNAFIAAAPKYEARLDELLLAYAETLNTFGLRDTEASLKQLFNPAEAMAMVTRVASQLAAMVSDTALVLLTTAFILLEVASIPRKFRKALGDPDADLSRYQDLSQEVKQYVVIKSYLSLAMGAVLGVFLWLLGVDFPVLWALLAALMNFIPNIGAILSAVPPVLLALVQFGFGHALGTATAYIVAHVVLGNMLEPRLLGRNLGLSTLVVFLSLVFWGWLWGPLGMVLSVPLTMIVKILLEGSAQFSPVAELLEQPLSYRTAPLADESRPTWDRVNPR
jgi:AI-2 transport protein TqsA